MTTLAGRGRNLIVCGLIAALWVSVFVGGMAISHARPPLFVLSAEALLRMGALRVPMRSSVDLLRIATCWTVHIDLIHLLSNLLVLVVVTWLWPSRARLPLAVLIGALGAGGATLFWSSSRVIVSCGGSGVLLSLLIPLLLRAETWQARLGPLLLAGLLLSGGIVFAGDWAAHVGGISAGVIFSLLIERPSARA